MSTLALCLSFLLLFVATAGCAETASRCIDGFEKAFYQIASILFFFGFGVCFLKVIWRVAA